jgi:hypothetical protein
MVKSKMSWAGNVMQTGQKRYVCIVLVGKPEGKNDFQDLGINGMILKDRKCVQSKPFLACSHNDSDQGTLVNLVTRK